MGNPDGDRRGAYALQQKMLFFERSPARIRLRRDPPDRYVFQLYRASYAEETEAVVRYLVKVRGLKPEQIAVFAQQDGYGDPGFAGVAKAIRAAWRERQPVTAPRLRRNTVDVDEAIARLRAKGDPDQGGGHGCDLSGRRKIHREDARSYSRG